MRRPPDGMDMRGSLRGSGRGGVITQEELKRRIEHQQKQNEINMGQQQLIGSQQSQLMAMNQSQNLLKAKIYEQNHLRQGQKLYWFHFRWLKIQEINASFPISITLFSNHLFSKFLNPIKKISNPKITFTTSINRTTSRLLRSVSHLTAEPYFGHFCTKRTRIEVFARQKWKNSDGKFVRRN